MRRHGLRKRVSLIAGERHRKAVTILDQRELLLNLRTEF